MTGLTAAAMPAWPQRTAGVLTMRRLVRSVPARRSVTPATFTLARSLSTRGGDRNEDEKQRVMRFAQQKALLDAVLSEKLWLWGKVKIRSFLLHVLDVNEHFGVEEFMEGAEMCFHALGEAMYGSPEVDCDTLQTMCSARIAKILIEVMREYETQGTKMFPTAAEPSGYSVHSVRIADLTLSTEDADGKPVDHPVQPGVHEAEGGQDGLKHWVHISVEYKVTETFTMVGGDGHTIDGSDMPRERTMIYELRGRRELGEDFGWHIYNMEL